MRKNSGPNTDLCATLALIDSQLKNWPFKTSKRLFDVYYGEMTQSIEEHFRLPHCFKFV